MSLLFTGDTAQPQKAMQMIVILDTETSTNLPVCEVFKQSSALVHTWYKINFTAQKLKNGQT